MSDLNKLYGDASAKCIYKYKYKKCQMKNKVVGTASKRIFDCVAPSGNVFLNCYLPNVIYVITCIRCLCSMLERQFRR